MEYIVSARKYRPGSFDAVVGQQALTTTLKNAVASGKLAHAYLFCGPRGVGKTTCARIFAKVINCEHPTPEGDACGECESCKAFAEQRSLNIFELDAASNNGVEHIKNLMEQTRVPPQVGQYKVFIIDEVHMLSTAAFNAFLKTLEEPPSYVVFILATTEKHKILPTILSRCQVYDFDRMTVPNIIGHLKKVADDQGITYEEEALNLIAEKADGGMRDALSIFDQAASFCQGNITYQKVIEDLNVLDADNYFNCLDLALENKVADVMVLLNGVLEKGFDGGHFVNGLASHIRNVLMAKDASTLKLIETSEFIRQRYAAQAAKCDTRFLYSALKILNGCDVNYRQSSNKRLLVELSLIEVAQITQKEDDASVGRLPYKRLKALFRKMNAAVQSQPASQGAGTGQTMLRTAGRAQQSNAANSSAQGNISPTSTNAVGTSSASPANDRQRVKLNNIGMSFSNILNKKQQTVQQETEVIEKPVEESIFTANDLQIQWLAMCNRMGLIPEMTAISKRMKNIVPVITDYPAVEVVVENQMFKDELQTIRKRIEATLSKYLSNGRISLTIRIAEQQERQKLLTPKEMLDELVETNEAFKLLKGSLSLELE